MENARTTRIRTHTMDKNTQNEKYNEIIIHVSAGRFVTFIMTIGLNFKLE